MCNGSRKPSPPPSPPAGPVSMDKKSTAAAAASLLLELAASNDVAALQRAVEEGGAPLDAAAAWYGRSFASHRMALELRTPLHVAALYGSAAVVSYLISADPNLATARSASDAATPLHCAAAGGAPSSPDVVKMLLSASADVDALDAAGNRPGDVVARTARSVELLLKPTYPREELNKVEKKEYPQDVTLPDIKTGIYGTDEFRMYTFKVKPCSRAYSHDWTECPFVHPGENARRRDPRKFVYSCVPCPEFRKGSCRNADACEYAHGVFESWLHPAQYRTRLCKDETGCSRRVCFFAHKTDELRTVNPMAGITLPASPRSQDMAALMMMQPGSPMSPSASSTSPAWMNQPPALQLSGSRLKSSLSSRNIDFNLELVGLEGYQQKLINELSGAASPHSNLRMNALTAAAAAASRASDYSDLLGSLDPSMLSQLQELSLKQASNGMQRLNQQLMNGYGGNLPSSPTMTNASSSLGLDHSTAKAILSSRASAFAQRSQSFVDRGAVARQASLATSQAATSGFSNWGSPDGKLDWGFQGDELNKLRKSASFGFRSSGGSYGGSSGSSPPAAAQEEPDLSWVHSLVKDAPAAPVAQPQKTQYQVNGAARDYLASDMLSPWAEQEQLMA